MGTARQARACHGHDGLAIITNAGHDDQRQAEKMETLWKIAWKTVAKRADTILTLD